MKIKTTSILTTAFLLSSGLLNAQTVIFTETMGLNPVNGNTAVSVHEANDNFDNDSYTMSGSSGINQTQIRSNTDNAPSPYSGGNHIYLVNQQNNPFFQISGITISGQTNLYISFAAKNMTATSGSGLTVQWRNGNGNWTTLGQYGLNLSSAGWRFYQTQVFNPGNTSALEIKIVQSGNVAWRMDDVSLSGTVPCTTPTISAISSTAPNATLCESQSASTNLSATVSGTGTYSFQWQFQNNFGTWQNIVSPTASGTATAPFNVSQNASPSQTRNYRVVATQASCSASSIQQVTIVPDPVLTLTSTNITCFGDYDGTAAGSLIGGTSGNSYNLEWSPGNPNGEGTLNVTDLGPGTYTLDVTGLWGCNAIGTVTITEPTKLNISATNTPILCYGDTSVVTVNTWGGTTPYILNEAGTYQVVAGTYSYYVEDANGCDASTTIDIAQPDLLTVNAGSDETVFYGYGPMECADLNATVNGGTPAYSVAWSSTASGGGMGTSLTACPTANETYTVSVVDANGCSAADQLSICVVDVICYAGNSSIQKVEMCQIPPGNPANAHTICIDASAVPVHLAIGCQLGECGELAAACSAPAAKNLASEEVAAALVAYPNPTENTTAITVTLTKAGNYSVEMFDMMGKLVKTVYTGSFDEYENLEFDVDMTNLNTGVYMISVSSGDQRIENIRVMKN